MAHLAVEELRELQATLNSSIDSYIDTINAKEQPSVKQRSQALESVTKATNALSDAISEPFEAMVSFGFQPTVYMALRIVLDLDLLKMIGDRASLQELAEKTGAERRLLFRVLRVLVSARLLKEPEEKVYEHTAFSRVLLAPPLKAWAKMCWDTLLPIYRESPEFLAKNGYKDIADLSSNPTLQLYGKNFFDQLEKDPKREADFATAMQMQDFAPPSTWPNFNFQEGASGFSSDPEAVFIVDVGGGKGQYLERLHEHFPSLPGHNVCQDIPSVIDTVSQDYQRENNFLAMKHDFFKPQTVFGARYYHLRGILHDWPDSSCVEILKQLRPALTPGYSKLLVQSMVLPEMGCTQFEAMNDLNMWTCCGRDRTESEFQDLLAEGGFKLTRIIRAEIGQFSVIEAELDGQDGRSKI